MVSNNWGVCIYDRSRLVFSSRVTEMKPGRVQPFPNTQENTFNNSNGLRESFNNNLAHNNAIQSDKDVLDFLLFKLSNSSAQLGSNSNVSNPYTEIGKYNAV